eukprot:CAMPEP_0179408248 /NCGR_PEP_ID=MMETSP0799-20121207/1984_1 /TAXON_ID=46947 /ORGANISM="Geminigera cryophila, Strain CCMP2564" /LENGTH=206 /DNA_ID=CAMNT_0021179681 /DNA_START=100 /DNA_END=717 /DNA_ORIENTATION=+
MQETGMQVGATSVVLPTKMAARTLHSRTRHTGPTHQGCIAPSGSSLPYLPITQWNSGGPPGNYHSFLNNRNLRPSKTAGEEDMPPANPDPNSVHSYLVAESMHCGSKRRESPIKHAHNSVLAVPRAFSAVTPRSNWHRSMANTKPTSPTNTIHSRILHKTSMNSIFKTTLTAVDPSQSPRISPHTLRTLSVTSSTSHARRGVEESQ